MMAARILLVAAATMAEEGFRLHRGPRHAALYGEYRAARRRCDARRLWRPKVDVWRNTTFARQPGWLYRYHNDTPSWQGCAYGGDRVAVAPWAENLGARGVRFWRLLVAANGREHRCAARRYAPRVVDPAGDPRGPARGRWAAPRLEECAVAVAGAGSAEGNTTWTFQRLAPLVGVGGYDWHGVAWDGVADFGPADVDAWFVGAVAEDGAALGFPPVHVHHAHARRRSDARGEADAAPGGAEASGPLVFEAHADSNCAGGAGAKPLAAPGDGGAGCFLRALPSGVAVKVDARLFFDAQFNDARPRDTLRPLRFGAEVALRWHPRDRPRRAAALATLGNFGAPHDGDAVGELRLTLAHGRTDAPAVYAVAGVVGGDVFRRAGGAAQVLDAHVHTHQRFAASAYVLAGGVEDFPYVPPLPAPYAPAVVDRPALDALRARLLAEPALRFASSRPGLDVVAAGDGAAPGVYDRHAELGRARGDPWVLADGDRVTAVFLDDYGAAAAAAGRAPAPGDFSASMAGLVAGDAAVSPQHYILRLTLAALEGDSGSGPLRCCCVPAELSVAADPAGAYYAAMARAREFAATLTAEGQARARALPLPRRPSNAMGAHPGAEVAANVTFLRSPLPHAPGAELWVVRSDDCDYHANCG